jgi:2-epi-5-epi-valiolone synthase
VPSHSSKSAGQPVPYDSAEAKSEWSSTAQVSYLQDGIALTSLLHRCQRVAYLPRLLESCPADLASFIHPGPALVVLTPTVSKLYGARIASRFRDLSGSASSVYLELNCTEQSKDMSQAAKVCEAAVAMNLRRGGQIIGIGGGVCLDIVGLAASIYRRGVRHIKIPTTLIGLIDAGIGVKNGVNCLNKKSALGSFYPPEVTLIDRSFLQTLAPQHIRDGLAEALKMAVIRDAELFELIEASADAFTSERLQDQVGEVVIRRAISGMLAELSQNLYELDSGYCRAVDFGHTFSPHIEAATGYQTSHGRAVAIDMALSTVIAALLGHVSWSLCDRIVRLIDALGLPTAVLSPVDAVGLLASLDSVVAHRNGALNLVVPAGLGRVTFVQRAEISLGRIQYAKEYLETRHG